MATALAIISVLMAASHSRAEESPAVRKGPRVLLVLDEDQVLAFEQVITNDYALLQNNMVLPARALDMLRQLRSTKPVYWMTSEGPKLRWNIEWSLPRHILAGSTASRYHCRQTHDSFVLHWKSHWHRVHSGFRLPDEYWGEDGGFDENENPYKFAPAMCDYYNQRSETLYEKISNAPATFGGFPVVPPPWAPLMWATDAVNQK